MGKESIVTYMFIYFIFELNHYFYELSLYIPNKQLLTENYHLSPSCNAEKYNIVKPQGGKTK